MKYVLYPSVCRLSILKTFGSQWHKEHSSGIRAFILLQLTKLYSHIHPNRVRSGIWEIIYVLSIFAYVLRWHLLAITETNSLQQISSGIRQTSVKLHINMDWKVLLSSHDTSEHHAIPTVCTDTMTFWYDLFYLTTHRPKHLYKILAPIVDILALEIKLTNIFQCTLTCIFVSIYNIEHALVCSMSIVGLYARVLWPAATAVVLFRQTYCKTRHLLLFIFLYASII